MRAHREGEVGGYLHIVATVLISVTTGTIRSGQDGGILGSRTVVAKESAKGLDT